METRFYTGVPVKSLKPKLYSFWKGWIARYTSRGLTVVSREVGARKVVVEGGAVKYELTPQKRIDIRIAFDMRTCAAEGKYDVVLLFSQDDDFAEAALEIAKIGRQLGKEIVVVSAFPTSGRRWLGVTGTRWIRISKEEYDGCLDQRERGA